MVAENYPALTATANFRDLPGPARRDGKPYFRRARERFNQAVRDYDTAISSFPAVLYASSFGFASKPYFTATPAANSGPPPVQFNFSPTTSGH